MLAHKATYTANNWENTEPHPHQRGSQLRSEESRPGRGGMGCTDPSIDEDGPVGAVAGPDVKGVWRAIKTAGRFVPRLVQPHQLSVVARSARHLHRSVNQ